MPKRKLASLPSIPPRSLRQGNGAHFGHLPPSFRLWTTDTRSADRHKRGIIQVGQFDLGSFDRGANQCVITSNGISQW